MFPHIHKAPPPVLSDGIRKRFTPPLPVPTRTDSKWSKIQRHFVLVSTTESTWTYRSGTRKSHTEKWCILSCKVQFASAIVCTTKDWLHPTDRLLSFATSPQVAFAKLWDKNHCSIGSTGPSCAQLYWPIIHLSAKSRNQFTYQHIGNEGRLTEELHTEVN